MNTPLKHSHSEARIAKTEVMKSLSPTKFSYKAPGISKESRMRLKELKGQMLFFMKA
jgi:hypothetical protein